MTWATEMLDNMKRGAHPAPPIVKTLRLGLIDDWGEGWIEKSWRPDEDLLQADGTMFGGYIAALFDQAFAFAAMTVIGEHEAYRTSNLNVSFLSLSRSEPITLRANVVARSKRLITVDGKMLSPTGTIRAIATAQQITTRKPPMA